VSLSVSYSRQSAWNSATKLSFDIVRFYVCDKFKFLQKCLILMSHVQPTASQRPAPEPPEPPPPHSAQTSLQWLEQVPHQTSKQIKVQVSWETTAVSSDMSGLYGVSRRHAGVQQPKLSNAIPSTQISSLRTSTSKFPFPPESPSSSPTCSGQNKGDRGAQRFCLAPLLPGV